LPLYMYLDPLLFFYQAEDGIRDRNVTGVQTCALPISKRTARPLSPSLTCGFSVPAWMGCLPLFCTSTSPDAAANTQRSFWKVSEIGRASCRERVEIAGEGE